MPRESVPSKMGSKLPPATCAPISIPWLSYHITTRCTRNCGLCEVRSPWLPQKPIPRAEIARDVKVLARSLHTEVLFVSGGEPLLHPELEEVLLACRDSGLASRIHLLTNGERLASLPARCWKLVDAVEVSVYPDGDLPRQRHALEKTAERVGRELRFKPIPLHNVVWTNHEISDRKSSELIYTLCSLRGYTATMQRGVFAPCTRVAFFDAHMASLGLTARNRPGDTVQYRDNPAFARELVAFAKKKRPFLACRYCLGSVGRDEPAAQISRAEVKARATWVSADPNELVDNAKVAAFAHRTGIDLADPVLPPRLRLGFAP